jgi:hypothetical protein
MNCKKVQYQTAICIESLTCVLNGPFCHSMYYSGLIILWVGSTINVTCYNVLPLILTTLFTLYICHIYDDPPSSDRSSICKYSWMFMIWVSNISTQCHAVSLYDAQIIHHR